MEVLAWRLRGGSLEAASVQATVTHMVSARATLAGDGHAHGQCTSNAGRRGSTVTALLTLTTLLCYGGGLHSASQPLM